MLLDLLPLEQLQFVDKAGTVSNQGTVDPDALFRRLYDGLITSGGVFVNRPGKVFSGTLTQAGDLVRRDLSLHYVGAVVSGSVLFRYVVTHKSGAVVASGVSLKMTQRSLSSQIVSTSNLTKFVSHTHEGLVRMFADFFTGAELRLHGFFRPIGGEAFALAKLLSGQASPSGQMVRQGKKLFAGAVGVAAVVSVVLMRRVLAAIGSAGTLIRDSLRSWGGVVSPSSLLRRELGRGFASSIQTAASVLKRPQRRLGSTMTANGALGWSVSRVRSFVGAILPAGGLRVFVSRTLLGALGAVGALVRSSRRAFSGGVSPSGVATPVRTRIIEIIVSLAVAEVKSLVYALKSALSVGSTGVEQVESQVESASASEMTEITTDSLIEEMAVTLDITEVGQTISVESRTVLVELVELQQEISAVAAPQEEAVLASVGAFGQLIEVIDRPG